MDPRKLSAQELLQLCLESRDEALWVEFVCRFQPTIAGVIRRRILRYSRQANSFLVDDLTQDVFLKLCLDDYKVLRRFKFYDENSLHNFLKVVASRLAEDYFRKRRSDKDGGGYREESLDDIHEMVAAPFDSSESAELSILRQEIDQCLRMHSEEAGFERDYLIFLLYFVYGFTAKAIAGFPDIHLSVKGVESSLLRLTRLLRLHLQPGARKKKASR